MPRSDLAIRIGRAIHRLAGDEQAGGSLDAVARAVGLSRFHFQRAFKSHTGLTPGAFRNAARLARARALLRAGRPVLDAALDAGFSGPGRLHAVAVAHDGWSPGELSAAGAGARVFYSWGESVLGPYVVASTARGVCALRFADRQGQPRLLDALAAEWPAATLVHAPNAHREVAAQLRPDRRRTGALRLDVRGTNLQVQVWRALLAIPAGAAITYGELARAIGRPRAARAVGTAVAANPVAVLIPCHRVIRATGVTGDYRWGADRKVALLAWERALLAP